MPQFEVILPEGTVILKNVETGETLRLSAEAGPLSLGRVTLGFDFAPAPAAGYPDCASDQGSGSGFSEKPSTTSVTLSEDLGAQSATQNPSNGCAMDSKKLPTSAADSIALVPSSTSALFPPTGNPHRALHENPFLSPDEPMTSTAAGQGRRFIRALEAPFDALTESDFEATLSSLAADSVNLEGEIEFLRDIDGDPDDIAELEAAHDAIKDAFARTTERFEAWKKAVRHAGKDEAKARAERLEAAAEAAEAAKTLAEELGIASAKKPIKAASTVEKVLEATKPSDSHE